MAEAMRERRYLVATCSWCGGGFKQPAVRGRPRRFCDDSCRDAAYAARRLRHNRPVMIDVLTEHQRKGERCRCGWGLAPEHWGQSFAEHVTDRYENAMAADAARGRR